MPAPPPKIEKIQDEALRESLRTAHGSLVSGNYPDVVRRVAEAYIELLRRKPEILEGPMGRFQVFIFPRLGAHLVVEQGSPPSVVYDRDHFGFSEAVTYFEFALDALVREGL
jgi:hypothetical protein